MQISRNKYSLFAKEIEKVLFEDIPLDEESIISDDDNLDEKETLAQQDDVFEQKEPANIEGDGLAESDSDKVFLSSFVGDEDSKWTKVNFVQPNIVFTQSSDPAKDIQEMQEPTLYSIFCKLLLMK